MATPSTIAPWDDHDRIALKEFLERNPKFLQELQRLLPEVSSESMEKAALTGQRRSGAEMIRKAIINLGIESNTEPPSDFVDTSRDELA